MITPTDSMQSVSPIPSERQSAILSAAIELFGSKGYYGTSLQKIATEVGLTKAGVLHYIGSKEGLLNQVLTDQYDMATSKATEPITTQEHPLLSQFWRAIVSVNATRPQMVRMFSTLSAEALDPSHPAHDYFERRERNAMEIALDINWFVPQGINCADVIQAGFSMMDGIQLRWLRTPGKNLNKMWIQCETVLFPSPLWNNYR